MEGKGFFDDLKCYGRFLREVSGGFTTLKREELLREIAEEISGCRRCPLYKNRKKFVPGEGNPFAEIFFVGEAPGAQEDLTGRPFVGRAGELLTRIIKAMGYTREEVFIGNVVKCRPPGNRTPTEEEQRACFPFLVKQIEIIKPRVLIALGRVAAVNLTGEKATLSSLRGAIHSFRGIPVVVTYHPSYLLQRGEPRELKKMVWEDMKLALKVVHGQV